MKAAKTPPGPKPGPDFPVVPVLHVFCPECHGPLFVGPDLVGLPCGRCGWAEAEPEKAR